MWHRELTERLRSELPRWRWTSHLTHRGGMVEGRSQKQHIKCVIAHARGHWTMTAWGLMGHRQPQWDVTIEDAAFNDFDDMLVSILAECM